MLLDQVTYCELANYRISKRVAVILHVRIVEYSCALLRVLYGESVRKVSDGDME